VGVKGDQVRHKGLGEILQAGGRGRARSANLAAVVIGRGFFSGTAISRESEKERDQFERRKEKMDSPRGDVAGGGMRERLTTDTKKGCAQRKWKTLR